jgi:hypothetical protein
MDDNVVLTVLSDAIDLQRETMQVLRDAVAALKAAVEELKANRNTVTITPYTGPTTAPYTPYVQPYISPYDPNWSGTGKIICGDSQLSVQNTCGMAKGGHFVTGITISNRSDVCGKR